MVGGLRDVITCAEFQIEIFMGYDFTGGQIFDFPIDFSMGLTTVQRYCAACDTPKLQCPQTASKRNCFTYESLMKLTLLRFLSQLLVKCKCCFSCMKLQRTNVDTFMLQYTFGFF